MENVFDILMDRGYTKQVSHQELRDKLGNEKLTFYTGYDPTADSLHVGHFIQLMTMSHMQKAGHQPIVLIGGGTVTVGDPSGRSDLRLMMTMEQIQHNADAMKEQMTRFMDFSPGKAIMVNNADWLLKLNYIDFLRDIGVHFSVNRMLAADCYKNRLEDGLTFFEFNYMLMQSFDFLHLYREYGATLQCGGDDQWSNILSGADLIRRVERAEAFALTTQLLTNSDGSKMGKTAKGALWLDPKRTSPYEFYQYWRNVEDSVVQNCLAMLTYLPMEEVRRLGALQDSEINEAKKVLALEVTRMIHGEEEAQKAVQASEALFGGGGSMENIPTTFITEAEFAENPKVTDLMALCGLAKSRGEARRLVDGGGVSVDDAKVADIMAEPDRSAIAGEGIIIRKGKKHYHRIILK